ncbi:phosphatidylinositol phosphatase PTPRQ [Caerostris extrusa]|uniref:Phosphatidylinositol phosphatase PTPRQ n=1 Tax=Caerostris extrusa TaxID=172846 RepID=A0AAV4Y4C9_CAEEX|nr:phosphatidylinositol phosphatase PTPRQ [Caerostris extrusa]
MQVIVNAGFGGFYLLRIIQILEAKYVAEDCHKEWNVKHEANLHFSWEGENRDNDVMFFVDPITVGDGITDCSKQTLKVPFSKKEIWIDPLCSNTKHLITASQICADNSNVQEKKFEIYSDNILAPSNIKADEITNTTIKLKWNPPVSGAPITAYQVWESATDNFKESPLYHTNKPEYKLANLVPFTQYFVIIRAMTESTVGPWSEKVSVQTKIGVPLAPTGLTTEEITSSSISVKWKEPKPSYGAILAYTIKWSKKADGNKDIKSISKDVGLTNYKIENLEPYTEYSVQERARTEAGPGPWSSILTVKSAVGNKLTNTSFEFTWKEPSPSVGPIISYVVVWTNDTATKRERKITNKYCRLEGLPPYTNYTIKIRAETSAGLGKWTDPFVVRTLSGGVTNLTICIKWNAPTPFKGPIVLYTVRWKHATTNKIKNENTKSLSYCLQNLEPYTYYDIDVKAKTGAGYGPWSEAERIQTAVGIPHEPEDVKAIKLTNTSFELTWKEPSPSVGAIINYVVEWTDDAAQKKEFNVNNLYCTLKDLSPYTNYTTKVRAETSAGLGKWANSIVVRTLSGVPLAPKNIQKSSVTNLTICINWKEPTPFKGPIAMYTVRWIHETSSLIKNGSTEMSSYCLQNLEPYTYYNIDVNAKTEAGYGPWSEAKKYKLLTEVIPYEPKDVKAVKVTNTSIGLTWREPSPSVGVIINYVVEWTDDAAQKKQMNIKDLYCTLKDLSPYTNYTIQVRAQTSAGLGKWADSIIVRTLAGEPYTYYDIDIKAETEAGYGPWSEAKRIQTAVGIPHEPKDVKAIEVTNTSIGLTWIEPSPSVGPIINYVVEWTDDAAQKKQMNVKDLYCTLKDLSPYTNYTIQVKAETSAGFGKWANSIVVRTLSGVPLAPKNIQQTDVTDLTICINWKEPTPFKGPIVLYTVRWKHANTNIIKNDSTKSLSYCLQNLKPYTYYDIDVNAKTAAGYGPWSEAKRIQTAVGRLTWIEPSPSVGPIINYVVEWTDDAAQKKQMNVKDLYCTLKDLSPYTNYTIQVKAETSAGFGKWANSIVVRTLSGVPLAPKNIQQTDVTDLTICINWKEPTPFKGPIVLYTVRWKHANTNIIKNDSTKSLSYCLQNLKPYTYYDIDVNAKTAAGYVPHEPKDVKAIEVTNTSIGLTWIEPSPSVGPIINYVVEWTDDAAQKKQMNVKDLYCTLKDLSPYTNYTIQVKAETSAGFGKWANSIVVRTLSGVPLAPKNIQQTDVTDLTICINWKEPTPFKGPIVLYTVRWKHANTNIIKNDSTKSLSYCLQNLKPYTYYDIDVNAKTAAGYVPHEPKDVKAIEVTNTSIGLTWIEPSPSVGPIINYVVEWTDDAAQKKQMNVKDLYCTLKNLSPYTNYTIQVRAGTSAGLGKWANSIVVRTLSGVPLAPKNIQQTDVTNLTICINWKEPTPFKGPIVMYTVRWKHANTNIIKNDSTKSLSYCLQNLEPYTYYDIDVNAKTAAGYGPWSEAKRIQTAVGIPYEPKEVKADKVSNTSIGLTWREPSPSVGPIINYVVEWTDDAAQKKQMNVKDLYCTLKDLSPYTNYTIQVRAETSAGLGKWANSIVVRTLSGVPLAPKNVQKSSVTNLTICINWKEPTPFKGPIVLYTVRWKHANTNIIKNDSTKSLSYCLQNLEPYTYYDIDVNAKTAAGYGPWSEAKRIQTAVGIPYEPKEIKADKVSNTSIGLTWKEPSPSVGPIINYVVEWTDDAAQKKQMNIKDLYCTLKDLPPYTNYTIQVRAETSAGLGKWANSIVVRTLSGVPLAPTNIENVGITNLTICINWKEPTPFKGPIVMYTVRWEHETSSLIKMDSTEMSLYCLKNLEPYTYYDIDVKAKTKAGYGPWSEAKKIQTAVGIPTIIRDLKEKSKTAWRIQLTWLPPDPSNGPLQDYEVKWGKTGMMTTRNLTQNTTFLAENLTPHTEYSFQVSASTSVGFGLPSAPLKVRTGVARPSAPIDLELVSSTNVSLLVRWKSPRVPNGPISGYTVKWKNVVTEITKETVTQSLQHKIVGLDPYTNYSIRVSAKTSAGSGPWTDALVTDTKTGIPYEPKEVKAVKVTNTTIELTWKKPLPSVGVIINYVVEWTDDAAQKKQMNVETLYCTLENLSPYTNYTIKVRAETSAGLGKWADSIVGRTLSGVPSAPIALELVSATNVSLLVRWKSPRVPNGPILLYTVQWMKTFSETINENVTESLQHEIVDLDPYANYSIWISAKTSAGSGPWTDALVAVPKPAHILSVKNESSKSVTVEWNTLEPYPGPTTYVLEVWKKPGPCEGNRGVIRHKTIEGSRGSGEWTFKREETVEGLVPYTEYYVRILLKTAVDESASANSDVIKTDPDTPGEL